jgi:hypothetical protein
MEAVKMAKYEKDEIVGFHVGQEVVCDDCAEEDDREEADQKSLITAKDLEHADYFCDRCDKRIS